MTPYYEQDGITIYHGDCREVLPTVTADVLVTDPPYGVSFGGKATKHTVVKGGGYTTNDSDVGPAVVAQALSVVGGRGLVFCGNRLLQAYPVADDIGGVYCPSGAGIGRAGFVCFHPCLFYGKRPTSQLRPSSIHSFATSPRVGHPCPKPLEWMQWAVRMWSIDTDVIIDPFLGSGTTLLAAKGMGRRAIGIEIEERYCEIAAERLSQRVLPLEMGA